MPQAKSHTLPLTDPEATTGKGSAPTLFLTQPDDPNLSSLFGRSCGLRPFVLEGPTPVFPALSMRSASNGIARPASNASLRVALMPRPAPFVTVPITLLPP
jgi:hypothetical protein